MHIAGIFCPLTKAFDCMNHKILLAKLHFYGIKGICEEWFRYCSTNRRQKAEAKSPNITKNPFSNWGTLKLGIPPRIKDQFQSIAHNIHYDLPLRINSSSETIFFADDTSNSSSSGNFSTLQKKIFRIMAGAQHRTTCKSLLKQLDILPLPCQYILPLTNINVNIQEHVSKN